MKKQIPLICILFITALGYIKYDTGFVNWMDSVLGFSCKNGFSVQQTISFSETFQTIPQVFLVIDKMDLQQSGLEFQLSITSITLTQFDFLLQCLTSKSTYSVMFRWYAIDDNRIQVINSFNLANPPTTKIFNHQLANAAYGIVIPTSLSWQGQIDFFISVSSLTSTTVTVDITNVPGKFVNLYQLGYQIILGTSEMFTILGTQSITTNYNSGDFTREKNKWLLVPIVGIVYTPASVLRIEKLYTYSTATTVSFTVAAWGYYMCPNTFQKVWMSYLIHKAMECQGMRISQKFDFEAVNRGPFYVQIVETNQIYASNGVYSTTISKTQSSLKITIIAKCQHKKNMVSKFNKCNSCPSNKSTYSQTHYCNQNINQISYFTRFKIVVYADQQISITITDTSCLITQILDNQIVTNVNLADVKLVQL